MLISTSLILLTGIFSNKFNYPPLSTSIGVPYGTSEMLMEWALAHNQFAHISPSFYCSVLNCCWSIFTNDTALLQPAYSLFFLWTGLVNHSFPLGFSAPAWSWAFPAFIRAALLSRATFHSGFSYMPGNSIGPSGPNVCPASYCLTILSKSSLRNPLWNCAVPSFHSSSTPCNPLPHLMQTSTSHRPTALGAWGGRALLLHLQRSPMSCMPCSGSLKVEPRVGLPNS